MSDELRADNFTDKSLQVRGNSTHTLLEELTKSLAERDKLRDTLSPLFNLEGILVADVHAH